jgi:hypothetical protein
LTSKTAAIVHPSILHAPAGPVAEVPGDPKGRTYAELIAEGQYTAASKGKTDAAREIADRLEGKAVQPIVGDTAAGMSVTLNIEVVRKKLFGDDE